MANGRRWVILAIGTLAQASTCCFLYGIPMLIPALRADEHLSLLGASVIVSAPMAGLLLTLIAWGAAADRYGERIVIASGVGAAAVLLVAAAAVHGAGALAVLLAVAGAAGASVNAASGRMVMGWFPVYERGLAMGARQTAQPLGVAIAALALPSLARAHGAHVALLFPAVLCAAAALAVVSWSLTRRGPPAIPVCRAPVRPTGGPGTWAGSTSSARCSSCRSSPSRRSRSSTSSGSGTGTSRRPAGMMFGFQVAGAAGRIASGVWSDRVRSRLARCGSWPGERSADGPARPRCAAAGDVESSPASRSAP